jgi:hypothetical protein
VLPGNRQHLHRKSYMVGNYLKIPS